MDAQKAGLWVGYKMLGIKCFFLWLIPALRKNLWGKYGKPQKSWLREFFSSVEAVSTPSVVKCDCGALGVDYKSEKHGWVYEGHHMWSCPKCSKK